MPAVKDDEEENHIKDDKSTAAMVSQDSKSMQTVSSTVENKLATGYRSVELFLPQNPADPRSGKGTINPHFFTVVL